MKRKQLLMGVLLCLAGWMSILGFSGCGGDEESSVAGEWLDAVPDWEQLRIEVPEAAQAARLRGAQAPVATFYMETARMARELNAIVYGFLAFIDDIVRYPPTESDDNRAVWAPEEPLTGLDATVPRFTLTHRDDGAFDYAFELRPKEESDYVTVWEGTMTPEDGMARRGQGQMALDFDMAASVDPTVLEQGRATVTYDIRSTEDRTISIVFEDFATEDDNFPADATYDYVDAQDNSGELRFTAVTDIYPLTSSVENAEAWTRWQSDGSGQTDAVVSGEDVTAAGFLAAETIECWDADFRRSFYSEYATWDEEEHPDWVATGVDNPIENAEKRSGDPETCPFGAE